MRATRHGTPLPRSRGHQDGHHLAIAAPARELQRRVALTIREIDIRARLDQCRQCRRMPGTAVAEHDRQMQEYYAFSEGSSMNRWRQRLATAEDPLDAGTQRQILTGLAILAALGVWRLNGSR